MRATEKQKTHGRSGDDGPKDYTQIYQMEFNEKMRWSVYKKGVVGELSSIAVNVERVWPCEGSDRESMIRQLKRTRDRNA